jgi:transcriptional regulator with XRE-family HTH domain
VGLTFQQIQKYERGANRIGASRMYDLSQVLDVPVSFFFDDMPEAARVYSGGTGLADRPQAVFEADSLNRRETLDLVRAYYRISDPKVRKRVFELAKSLASMETA